MSSTLAKERSIFIATIKKHNMSSGKALLGVMAGIAAGAVLGMLFAPEKGVDSRKNISKKGEDLANALNQKVEEKFDELIGTITGKVKKSKSNESVHSNTSEMAG
jgi:gas vesicle protein